MTITGRRQVLGGLGAAMASGLLPKLAFAQAQSIDIGAMGVGTSWYQYGVLLSQFFNKALPDGSIVNVRPYAGGDGNVRLIESNDRIQMGMTFSANLAWAKAGMTEISDATADNVRLLWGALDQYYLGMMAQASFQYDTMTEALESGTGLDISTLSPGTLAEIGTNLLLSAHDMTEASLTQAGGRLNRVGIQAASEALVTDRSDIWINPISKGHPRLTELSISNDIKILGLSEADLKKMAELGFTPAVLPGGSFRGQDEDVTLPGTSTTLIVNAEMDEETAYSLTKALIDNLDDIKSQNASLAGMSVERAADTALAGGIELHPGAARAFEEAGVI